MSNDFKIYIVDSKEYFVFRRNGQVTKIVKPLSCSMLELLDFDTAHWRQILQEMSITVPKLNILKDEALAKLITENLEQMAKHSVFFEYFYLNWSASLACVQNEHYENVAELLPYQKIFNQLSITVEDLQNKLLSLLEQVLDIDYKNSPVQERLNHYLSQKTKTVPVFTFAPQTTGFEAVGPNTFAEVLYPKTLEQMANFFVRYLVQCEVRFRKCKNCGKYFPLTGYSNAEYCERFIDDSNKTCKEVGALNIWQQKAKNPAYEAYSREYKKRFARIRYGKLSKEDFSAWAVTARIERERCRSGELELQAFAEWLHTY